jgi:MinD superfamily P-loop ATPase
MPKIILDFCDGCGLCIEACANEAIKIENKKAMINKELCLDCGVCICSCPNNAIVPELDKIKLKYHNSKPRWPTHYFPFYPFYPPIMNHYSHKLRRRRS